MTKSNDTQQKILMMSARVVCSCVYKMLAHFISHPIRISWKSGCTDLPIPTPIMSSWKTILKVVALVSVVSNTDRLRNVSTELEKWMNWPATTNFNINWLKTQNFVCCVCQQTVETLRNLRFVRSLTTIGKMAVLTCPDQLQTHWSVNC